MHPATVIAERKWLAVSADGLEHSLILHVESPQVTSRGDWTCLVSLGVLDPIAHEIVGMDSWQAVELAMRFIALRIREFERMGWRFYWDMNREPALPTELCPGL